MFEYLTKLFGFVVGTDDDEKADDDNYCDAPKSTGLCGFSYLFKKKRIEFDDQFSFTIHYFTTNEVWLAANPFAAGLGFKNTDQAVDEVVDARYKSTIDQLLFNNSNSSSNLVCVNKHGVLQLLDHIDFPNKAEFTAWLIENVFTELEGKLVTTSSIDEKLGKMLKAVDGIKQHNDEMARTSEQFKSQVIERFELFDRRIAELNEKMTMFDNVDDLYRRLRDHHRNLAPNQNLRRPSFLSSVCSSPSDPQANAVDRNHYNNDLTRYETVRFPRDTSKHPRLSVFVKPAEDGTKLAFLTSQQRRHGALKRKFNDMEMIYDNVHPNPQLAIQCINEELDLKNFDYRKQTRRILHMNCSVDTAKSFINENL
ncbi:38.7K protein [Agrotis segetum nucleopolyhedrovirus A]|uniref:38.7K protein n=1 Tax=Agrotis segetum nuclear polyhedrosis virus TaxID=1962501 RepID=Q287Q6_NPVAS|nr:38.7K protein [Agrotis segetum nucleopolyhedrovirus A]AAZ38182.1 38.7K protein [Agrotis segetum nucleopolyhedrovirus A]